MKRTLPIKEVGRFGSRSMVLSSAVKSVVSTLTCWARDEFHSSAVLNPVEMIRALHALCVDAALFIADFIAEIAPARSKGGRE